jgi:DNA mismatch repair protein MutL
LIRVLEKNVSDKIAAGEVIDRPVSVIKELVENSIDAGASSITVEIRHGGKDYMRVTDDGCGIPSAETETAFLRHATSKIQTAKDLDSIESLGFRGEALASVSAVSRTTLITRTADSAAGRKVVLHGGRVLSNDPVGCPAGTSMIVSDLFYNTPARRQFLKSDAAESSRIIELLSELAVAYCGIRFQVVNSGRLVFATSGNGVLKDAILAVTHQKEYEHLLPVKYERDGIQITGCISRPSLTRPSRRNQIYFVNGRVVKSRVLERGVSDGYKRRMFDGRYPVVFLFLHSDPGSLDVNIHPSKREVRFHDDKKIQDAVAEAVRQTLSALDAAVDVQDYYIRREDSYSGSDKFSGNASSSLKDWQNYASQLDLKQILKQRREAKEHAEELSPADHGVLADAANAASSGKPVKSDGILESGKDRNARSPLLDFDLQPEVQQPFDFDSLTLKGCIFNTYIMAEAPDGFYLFDQHAAHERCFYEELVGAYLAEKKVRQPILVPIILETEPAVSALEESWMPALDGMGFTTDSFGPDTYRITEIPAFMTLSEAEDFAHDFLDQVKSGSPDLHNRVVIDKLITRSCKRAVKAHEKLTDAEMRALMDQLSKCRNPFSCPHGRPTFIRFTRKDLEKFFKRIV